MKKKALHTIDPAKLSPGVLALNPHLKTSTVVDTMPAKADKTNVRRDKPDEEKMTGPERRMLARLQRDPSVTKIKPWGVRLRWGGNMNYTGDFYVESVGRAKPLLIEVKGPHIKSRDIVRFRGCREEWRHVFDFEMWQEDRAKNWSKIL